MKLVDILARELDEWPEDAVAFTQDIDGKAYRSRGLDIWFEDGMWKSHGLFPCTGAISVSLATDHATAIVTREMWEAERLRQDLARTDKGVQTATQREYSAEGPQPDWSKAPGGYPLWLEYLPKVLNRSPSCKEEGGEWVSDAGDKYNTLRGTFWTKPGEDYYRIHERPASPQWTGEGLPPVGDACLVEFDTYKKLWFKAKILSISDGKIVGRWTEGEAETELFDYDSDNAEAFRPIDTRTPREKWIDLADAAIHHGLSVQDNLGDIWDAGLAKLPEDGE